MKKYLLTLALGCLITGALSGCNDKEKNKDNTKTTQQEMTTEEAVNATEGSDEESTTEASTEENSTEAAVDDTATEISESDKYYLWWLRGQDFTSGQKEKPAQIPLYGGMTTPIDLENQVFTTWVANTGWNEERTELLYKNVSEVINDETETVPHKADASYQFQKEIDSGENIFVTFYNNTDDDITVKQAYENGWFSIWYPNATAEVNGSYRNNSILFEATGYEINENYSYENYNDYAFMEHLMGILGTPNFLSVHVGTGMDYREFEEYFELIKEKRDKGYYQVILGWEYDDYCIYVTLEDNVKYSTNDGVEYYDIEQAQFCVLGLDIYPASAEYWINRERANDAEKTFHIGENVFDKWNAAIANGDIPTSVVEY